MTNKVLLALSFALVGTLTPAHAALIGWWELDDAAGSTATATVGPNGTYENFEGGDFSQAGSPGDQGAPNSSVDLDGTPSAHRINLGASGGVLSTLSQASVSMWANFDDLSGNDDHTLMSIGQFGGGKPLIFWRDDDAGGTANTLALLIGGGSGRVAGGANILNDTGVWHHLAFTYDGGAASVADGMRIYLDGVNVNDSSSGTLAASIPLSPDNALDPLVAGQASNPGTAASKQFEGLMDEIAIYDQVLTPAQIASLAGGASPATIPEPSGFALLVSAVGLLALRRRR